MSKSFLAALIALAAIGSAHAAEPAKPEFPPKLTEVPAPAGIKVTNEIELDTVRLTDIARGPIPERLRDAVAWVRPYRTFKPTTEAGVVTMEITADGPVYLAATWVSDGRLEPAMRWKIPQETDFASRGWMAVSQLGIAHHSRDEVEAHTVFLRYCRAGDKFTFRTRTFLPPIVMHVAGDPFTPEKIAALEPDPALPELLQRSFTGAKALNLVVDRRFDELERWAGGLLKTGATFPSGQYRIRSVARAFQLGGSLNEPEHWERHLPDWNGWLAAYPDSNSARLVLASVQIDYSKALRYYHRGRNRGADVDEARRRALELLYEVEQSDPKLPHMYLEYMLLAREESWDEDLTTEYFRRAVASGSWCPQAVCEFVAYLGFRGGEDPAASRKKIQAHVESAVAATRAEHGDKMYAASIKDIQFYRSDIPLLDFGYDWPRLRASFDEILARDPSSRRTMRAYVRLAAAAGDKPVAERLFAKLGPYRKDDDEAWSDELEYKLNLRWAAPDFAEGDQRAIFDLSAAGAVGVVWTADGVRYLDRRGQTFTLDLKSGAQERIAELPYNICLNLAGTPGGEVLVGSGFYGRVGVESKNIETPLRFRLSDSPTVTYVAVARDGSNLAVAAQTGDVTIIDLTQDRPQIDAKRTLNVGKKTWIKWVGFTPDGERLITYADKEVAVWNVETLKRESGWTIDRQGTMAALSPDGKRLAIADGKFIQFWTLGDAKVLGKVELPGGATSRAMGFSPDGGRLAVGGGSYEQINPSPIHFLDAEKFKLIKTVAGHKGSVSGVVFSPDGRTLLSVSLDRSARLWDVP